MTQPTDCQIQTAAHRFAGTPAGRELADGHVNVGVWFKAHWREYADTRALVEAEMTRHPATGNFPDQAKIEAEVAEIRRRRESCTCNPRGFVHPVGCPAAYVMTPDDIAAGNLAFREGQVEALAYRLAIAAGHENPSAHVEGTLDPIWTRYLDAARSAINT